MKTTTRFVLLCNVAFACAACNATPQAEVASQPASTQPASGQDISTDAPTVTPASLDPAATGEQALMARAKVSRADATRTALAQVPNGTIQDGELEEEHQKLVWSFDIALPGSQDITEIQVDAVTGKIVSTQVETPTDQAQENAADKAGQ